MTNDKVQGEGDRKADRDYREDTREFIESEDVNRKAEEARPRDDDEARSMEEAEKKGKERAKEKDPSVTRDYSRPGSS